MKAEIKRAISPKDIFYGEFSDNGECVGITKTFPTESEAREACRKYFPQFKLEGDKPELPESFGVLNDGSDEFKNVFIPWFRSRYGAIYTACLADSYAGRTPFGPLIMSKELVNKSGLITVLSLSEFKAMIS